MFYCAVSAVINFFWLKKGFIFFSFTIIVFCFWLLLFFTVCVFNMNLGLCYLSQNTTSIFMEVHFWHKNGPLLWTTPSVIIVKHILFLGSDNWNCKSIWDKYWFCAPGLHRFAQFCLQGALLVTNIGIDKWQKQKLRFPPNFHQISTEFPPTFHRISTKFHGYFRSSETTISSFFHLITLKYYVITTNYFLGSFFWSLILIDNKNSWPRMNKANIREA